MTDIRGSGIILQYFSCSATDSPEDTEGVRQNDHMTGTSSHMTTAEGHVTKKKKRKDKGSAKLKVKGNKLSEARIKSYGLWPHHFCLGLCITHWSSFMQLIWSFRSFQQNGPPLLHYYLWPFYMANVCLLFTDMVDDMPVGVSQRSISSAMLAPAATNSSRSMATPRTPRQHKSCNTTPLFLSTAAQSHSLGALLPLHLLPELSALTGTLKVVQRWPLGHLQLGALQAFVSIILPI